MLFRSTPGSSITEPDEDSISAKSEESSSHSSVKEEDDSSEYEYRPGYVTKLLSKWSSISYQGVSSTTDIKSSGHVGTQTRKEPVKSAAKPIHTPTTIRSEAVRPLSSRPTLQRSTSQDRSFRDPQEIVLIESSHASAVPPDDTAQGNSAHSAVPAPPKQANQDKQPTGPVGDIGYGILLDLSLLLNSKLLPPLTIDCTSVAGS